MYSILLTDDEKLETESLKIILTKNFMEEVFNAHDLSKLDEYYCNNFKRLQPVSVCPAGAEPWCLQISYKACKPQSYCSDCAKCYERYRQHAPEPYRQH